jgi:hypothetical protein
MATSAAKRAKQSALPKSATITIKNQQPEPCGEVEVTPNGGRIVFENKDKKDHRLRFHSRHGGSGSSIDLLLPALGRTTVLIKKDDEFMYSVMNVDGEDAMTGHGGGPIKN